MRILVMTVGTGRDRQDIAKALLFSIRRHQPEQVLFFCSEKTAAETVPLLEDSLRTKGIEFEVIELPNENDVQFLYSKYLDYLKQKGKPEEMIIDFTSGTKAMTAALFAAAIAIEAGQVSYITGPRDETGRVIESTAVEAIYPAQVYAERQIERARLLFNKLDFVASKELTDTIRRTLPEGNLRQRAKTIWMLSEAYDLWERFSWKEAGHLLKKASNPQEGLVDVDCKHIAANAEFLHTVSNNTDSTERLVELMLNARRRLAQGRIDDALSRMYRAYEYLVQNILYNRYEIKTSPPFPSMSKFAGSNLSENLKQRLCNNARNNGGLIKLGLRDGLELLPELGHQTGLDLYKLYYGRAYEPGFVPDYQKHHGPLKGWLNQRNESYLAHGTKPAEEQTVKGLLTEYDRLLQGYIPADKLNDMISAATFIKL